MEQKKRLPTGEQKLRRGGAMTVATRKGDTSVHRLQSTALMRYTGATQKAFGFDTRGLTVAREG